MPLLQISDRLLALGEMRSPYACSNDDMNQRPIEVDIEFSGPVNNEIRVDELESIGTHWKVQLRKLEGCNVAYSLTVDLDVHCIQANASMQFNVSSMQIERNGSILHPIRISINDDNSARVLGCRHRKRVRSKQRGCRTRGRRGAARCEQSENGEQSQRGDSAKQDHASFTLQIKKKSTQ